MTTSTADEFWLVDEHNDWEGETFGLAIPCSPEVEIAMERWQTTYNAIAGDEDAPMSWRCGFTKARLDAMGEGSSNTYTSRVHFLSDDGAKRLLAAIADIQPHTSLCLYKGNLTQLNRDGTSGKILFDTWSYSDPGAMGLSEEDEDEGEEGDSHHLLSKVLVKYEENFGRMGYLSDIFVCTAVELVALKLHKPVYMDEALGKHSEVYSDLDDKTLTVLTDDQDFIAKAEKFGLLNVGCGVYSRVHEGWACGGDEGGIDNLADHLTPEEFAALRELYPEKSEDAQ